MYITTSGRPKASRKRAFSASGAGERGALPSSNFEQNGRMTGTQQQRLSQLEQQIAANTAERARREEENVTLAATHAELTETRARVSGDVTRLAAEATALRAASAEKNTALRTLRAETEVLREQRGKLETRIAKLTSDVEHLEAQALQDLNTEAACVACG